MRILLNYGWYTRSELEEIVDERERYRRGLEEICKMYKDTEKPVLDHWGMIALAKYVLDLNNDY